VIGWIDQLLHFNCNLLSGELETLGYSTRDLFAIFLYVSSMADFALINAVYRQHFALNPPVR